MGVRSYRLMGIVNVTPDSFSDGGRYLDLDAAVAHGLELVGQGADILDVGGESTRPGAEPVAPAEELRRVVPVVEALAARGGAASEAASGAAACCAGAAAMGEAAAARKEGAEGDFTFSVDREFAEHPPFGTNTPPSGVSDAALLAAEHPSSRPEHPPSRPARIPSRPEHPPFRISIDTSKASVARAALAAGGSLVNDVTALRGDPQMAEVLARAGCSCCLMHMRGEPRTMQRRPRYEDVVGEVKAFLEARMRFAVAAGIAEERILLDPGIGFGKTAEHNFELLRRLDELTALGRPVLIGTSRKSFLGSARLEGTIATNVLALERGARVFRVHDVAPVAAALASAAATLGAK